MKATPIKRLHRAIIYFLLIVVFFSYLNRSCFASTDGDFQFWTTAGASFDVNKDWGGAVEEILKFGHVAGNFFQHQTDLGFTYKSFADWIDIGLNYKQVYKKQTDGDWSREKRPHLNITFKGRLGNFDFSDRSRFEFRDKEYGDDLWRYVNKFEVNLPFEFTQFKFRPYVADQVYINMDGSGFEKNRIYAGFNFELTEDVESELYYVRQWSESDGRWQELSALGLQLKLRF